MSIALLLAGSGLTERSSQESGRVSFARPLFQERVLCLLKCFLANRQMPS